MALPASLRPTGSAPPKPLPATANIELPETPSYRLKRRLLGRPLGTDQLEHERLGNPTALAVFASDNLSSAAYGSEEILRVLTISIGVGAFALLVPITVAMLVVLFFLILSYRQTIKEYPSAGGAYSVTRDNFGLAPALVAGVSLLTDYVLTVSVSVAAGTAALASAFQGLEPYVVPISVGFVVLIAYLNLRGVRESGSIFRVPTFFFIAIMFVMLGVGLVKMVLGHLPMHPVDMKGVVPLGVKGSSILQGASVFVVLHAFASGGAAVTGVEAISNGVPAFRKPEWRNARKTLVVMGSLLGVMFLGVSVMAAKTHAVPFESGTPTVISQVGDYVFGNSAVGRVLYYLLQAATMSILVLAANTSFADFPRLASFMAGDNFMPKQLTKRGHRLVYSNGIVSLSAASIFLIIVTGAKVSRLIPLYAVGVFTSFTLSQSGMARHHLRLKEPGWRKGLVINAFGAFLSALVLVIIATTKFTEGAWVIVVLVPLLVLLLKRLSRQYVAEKKALEEDAVSATTAPILRRHVVLVFIDGIDRAAALAIQYARTLTPDELRVVHIAIDLPKAHELAAQWASLPLARIPLELVDCPDRRIARAALEVVAGEVASGDTEVTVLLPRRVYRRFWHRLLHDRTSNQIASAVGRLPHANVTTVPFSLESRGPASAHDEIDLEQLLRT